METTSDHDGLTISGLGNVSEHDDEMFLDAFATAESNDMTQLERDPNLLLGKFEDAYGSNGITGDEDLFRGGEDVFFGSP
jgi:regulatory protein SWI5